MRGTATVSASMTIGPRNSARIRSASATAPAGLSLVGSSLSVDPSNPAFDHLAVGDSTTITVSYNVTDAQGATVAPLWMLADTVLQVINVGVGASIGRPLKSSPRFRFVISCVSPTESIS